MPLIYRTVGPAKLSSGKLELKGKTDSEFIAVNNETFVNILRQLASVVTHAGDIFSDVASLTEQVGKRVRSVKLRLDELEAKADLFDPKLVPVPEGTLDDISNACTLHHRLHGGEHNEELVQLETTNLVGKDSRPKFLLEMYDNAGTHEIFFPPRSPILSSSQSLERQISMDSRRPASFAALRDWKLDDYLDDKIKTIGRKKQSAEALNRALASPFPSQLVQVNVTGAVFDRMKANRRSLVVHTKKIRKKRRNTICGSMPNKECGIQTSFNSIPLPGGDEDGTTSGEHRGKKYGIDSGHWSSSCTSSAQGVPGIGSCCSAPSPWDPNSLSTSSDFLFDEEDRCLTPQLENFTDGLVSDSDSVDTDGYFTSFRSDCGFPRMKKSGSQKELEEVASDNPGSSTEKDGEDNCNTDSGMNSIQSNITVAMATAKRISITENEYELFGKGSTSTTASSCGTVVMRNKPEPPARTTSTAAVEEGDKVKGNEDPCLEERVKRKSLIELVPSLVVVTPSPSCSSGSPPPLKDPGIAVLVDENISAEDSDGRLTPKADDLFTTNESECGTLSDTDSDRRTEVRLSDIAVKKRSTSSTSSTGTASTTNSTLTLTSCPLNGNSGGLPQPDVIPADAVVQQLQIIRTNKATPRLDAKKEYYSLDTVLLGSFEEELRHPNGDCKMNLEKDEKHSTPPMSNGGVKKVIQCASPPPNGAAASGKIRGARVVLDANGEIIFSSETLRRKRKQKVSFDPGSAVKSPDYDSNSQYSRVRESVYDRIKKDTADPEKLYECIEEIRRHNLKPRDQYLDLQQLSPDQKDERSTSSASSLSSSPSKSSSTPDPGLLETDLDSAIPPVMPDLKNLPKIKDRLKRNESYRIANTDEAKAKPDSPSPTPGKLKLNGNLNRSPLSSLHFNRNPSKRMLLTSPPSTSPTPLHLNKKRDIPEEDPTFIQQIFSINSANNKLSVNGNNAMNNSHSSSPFHLTPDNSKVLSKFSITPEDRPSFLRRDSPPTMDDIAKEIYRFRKKFNIQPNASTTTLTRPIQRGPDGIYSTGSLRGRPTESQVRNLQRPSSSTAQYPNVPANLVKSTIPVGFPRLSLQQSPKTPIAPPRRPQSSSGGVININRSPVHSSVYYPSYGWSTSSPASTPPKSSTPVGLPIPPSSAFGRLFSPSQTTPPIPPTRNFSRKIFPMRPMSSTSNSGASTPTSVHSLNPNQYQSANDHRLVHPSINNSNSSFRNYVLPSLPFRRNSVAIGEGSSAFSKTPRTSIGDFKKLLQATQKKRSSISAVEVLKPKGLETTI